MIEFMRGFRTPLRTTVIPESARTVSNRAGYFAVSIPDQVPHLASSVLEIHHEVAGGLGDSGGGRVGGGAQDPDPAGGVVDDRQDVQAGAGQGGGFEESRRR